jgi:spermidine synthase
VCAVKYRSPDVMKPENWATVDKTVAEVFAGRLDLERLKNEHIPIPVAEVKKARLMTDDFSPVEFLDALKTNNTGHE